MAEGTNAAPGGMAAPLYPADGFEIKQQTASSAVDILTVTAASSGTGDFFVAQNSSGTEKMLIDKNGSVILNKTDQTTFARLRLPILNTAPASAAMTIGDVWLAAAGTADVYRLAVCVSSVGTVKYGHRIDLGTIGSTT